jgi:hypothetical protein
VSRTPSAGRGPGAPFPEPRGTANCRRCPPWAMPQFTVRESAKSRGRAMETHSVQPALSLTHPHLCLGPPFPLRNPAGQGTTRSGPVSVLRMIASRASAGSPLVHGINRSGEMDGGCCSRRRGNRVSLSCCRRRNGNVSCCLRKAPDVRVVGQGSLVDPKRRMFPGTTRNFVMRVGSSRRGVPKGLWTGTALSGYSQCCAR